MPGWLWMLVGLAIGLFVALLVFLDAHYDLRTEASRASREPAPASPSGPAEPPQAASTSAPPKPRFDFYTILPELEVFIPEPRQSQEADAPPTPVESPGTYVLQTGSFQSNQEADRAKAELALIGIQATIQKVSVDRQTWHRVRIGPFDRLDELNDVRARLREHEIEAILLRVNS
jgi:cell division protein FtsN